MKAKATKLIVCGLCLTMTQQESVFKGTKVQPMYVAGNKIASTRKVLILEKTHTNYKNIKVQEKQFIVKKNIEVFHQSSTSQESSNSNVLFCPEKTTVP